MHGHTTHTTQSHEYVCWSMMKQRCLNPKSTGWPYYGARGITVCDRWLTFSNFLADVGLAPTAKHTLERMDNDGNYEPGNVRWATRAEQMKTRRRQRGKKYSAEQAADIRRRFTEGQSRKAIATETDVPYCTVVDIVLGRRRKGKG